MPSHSGTLTLVLPPVEIEAAGTYRGPVGTDVSNKLLGRRREGTVGAIVEVDLPVAVPPGAFLPVRVDKAISFPAPTVTHGIPSWDQSTIHTVEAPAGTPRVLVGGRDVTWHEATRPDHQPVQTPGYALTDPLAYGSSQPLVIPRVAGYFEHLGAGSLSWARKGAEVVYQRVYPGRIETDYVGVVTGIHPAASSLEVAGEVSGRAALVHRPHPVVRRVLDLGHWVGNALSDINVYLTPRGGPVTGIRIPDAGDMDLAAWLQNQCTESQTRTGARRTIMPVAWGKKAWHFVTRNTTTVDYTIYADGTRIVLDLYDDAAEQPNTWWATGVSPEGVRWRNARYPGYIPGEPPAYPMAGSVDFGIGTTDADTIHGDGITVLWSKLVAIGNLPPLDDFNGTYDSDIAEAVEDLKRAAGLADNGVMTPAAWDALFDISVTGFHFGGASLHPLLQDPSVRRYNYTSNGSLAGRNPAYDRRKLRVDRVVDFGPGVYKQRARDWLRGEHARTSAVNFAGTITLNQIGIFSGDHDGSDYASLTSADLVPVGAIRPNTNARLPYFAGGITVHISGVDVAADRQSATLTVDTQARDLLELQAIIARNKEARRNPRREWWASNRPTKKPAHYVEHDELFGQLTDNRRLYGGRWNVIPIVAGQTGTINRIWLRTFNRPAEFCVAVFGKRLAGSEAASERLLDRRVGNPFPLDFITGETVWVKPQLADFFEDHGLLYSAGTVKQPLGYGIRSKFDSAGDPTRAPLTGVHLDDASWGYSTPSGKDPVLFVAIYPDRRTTLRRGQVLWVLEDDVT